MANYGFENAHIGKREKRAVSRDRRRLLLPVIRHVLSSGMTAFAGKPAGAWAALRSIYKRPARRAGAISFRFIGISRTNAYSTGPAHDKYDSPVTRAAPYGNPHSFSWWWELPL